MDLNHDKGINTRTLYTHTHLILNIKLCERTTDPLYDKYSGLNYVCHFTPKVSFSDLIRESIPTLSSSCLTRRSIELNSNGCPIRSGMTRKGQRGHFALSLSFSDLIRESIESNPYGFPVRRGMTKGNYCLNKIN